MYSIDVAIQLEDSMTTKEQKSIADRITLIISIGALVTAILSLIISLKTYESAQNANVRAYADKAVMLEYGGRYLVQNYSTLPMLNVQAVGIPYGFGSSEPDARQAGPGDIILKLGNLPPCSQTEITDWVRGQLRGVHGIIVMRFTDINNRRWVRYGAGTPQEMELETHDIAATTSATVQPLSGCT
jgi:hypothetical protein